MSVVEGEQTQDRWQASDSEVDVPSAGWREVYHWCDVPGGD